MKLTLRRAWPDAPAFWHNDFLVMLNGEKGLARIKAHKRSDHEEVWSWSVYGFNEPQSGNMRGQEESFERAKTETKACILRLINANVPLMPDPPEWRPGSAFLEP